MGVDHIEPICHVPGLRDTHLVVERGVTGVALPPESSRHGGHDLAEELRVTRGKDGHLMTALVEAEGEGGHDALGARVHRGWKGQDRWRDDPDPKRPQLTGRLLRPGWKCPHG